MSTEYNVSIIADSGNLSKKDLLNIKGRLHENKIEDVMRDVDTSVIITPRGYARLHVNNPNAKPGMASEFDVFVVVADEGNFSTGSKTFAETFVDIYDVMKDETDPWAIGIDKIPSKNYTGKYFYSCHVE